MKALFFSALFSVLSFSAIANHGISDEYKVIVSEKKIWIMADETPVAKLQVQVKDQKGKVVLEKTFTSKCSDWSFSVTDLKDGEYTLWIAGEKSTSFVR